MESKQVNKNISNGTTKLVRIDNYYHRQLKLKAADEGVSIKAILEDSLAEIFSLAPKES